MANYILAYCNHQQTTMSDTLLRQTILLIGYYAVLNQDNQVCSFTVLNDLLNTDLSFSAV